MVVLAPLPVVMPVVVCAPLCVVACAYVCMVVSTMRGAVLVLACAYTRVCVRL